MKVSDLMQAMAAAGAPMEAILLAVRAIEEEQSKAEEQFAEVERRRAVERDRKRRQRDRERDESVNVTGQSRDSHEDSHAQPSLSLPPNENNSNPPTHTHPDNTTRARKADFPKPEWADEQVWGDFLKNRRVKKLPCTVTAYAKFLRDIDKLSAETGWPPGQCLTACVERGWGAIFDPRNGNNGRGNQTFGGSAGGRDRRDGVARALDRELGIDPPERYSTGGTGASGGNPVARLAVMR